ncbi:MAG: hypothetical protein ACKN9D_02005, partial [Actinomycetales bacterium]
MTILITNGSVVSPEGIVEADVLIDGARIAALIAPGDTSLGANLAASADRVIDATGKYVIPGGVDCHTHMELPFGGTLPRTPSIPAPGPLPGAARRRSS